MNETTDITLPTLVAISQLPGACFYRQNQGTFVTLDGKRVVKATSVEGCGDLMGCYYGRATAVETKTRRGKQLKSQRVFQKNWERAGGLYIIANSPDHAVDQLIWAARNDRQ